MSTATINAAFGDFDEWEHELAEPAARPRPTRASLRREDREVIDRELGLRRHRTREREA